MAVLDDGHVVVMDEKSTSEKGDPNNVSKYTLHPDGKGKRVYRPEEI